VETVVVIDAYSPFLKGMSWLYYLFQVTYMYEPHYCKKTYVLYSSFIVWREKSSLLKLPLSPSTSPTLATISPPQYYLCINRQPPATCFPTCSPLTNYDHLCTRTVHMYSRTYFPPALYSGHICAWFLHRYYPPRGSELVSSAYAFITLFFMSTYLKI
jgi:hypothetical protein